MARVAFTPNLQRHLPCPTQDADGSTVGAVLDAVFRDNPRLRSYILDDQGRVRQHIYIFLNNDRIADRERLSDPVKAEDEIYVMQALTGG